MDIQLAELRWLEEWWWRGTGIVGAAMLEGFGLCIWRYEEGLLKP